MKKEKEFNGFIKQEKKDLKQLDRDFEEQGYEIIWFVQDFLDVRRERIKDLK